jgi:hypothetical protein
MFNRFFTKYEKIIVAISLIIASIVSILLFDVKVSLSGDDCDYIVSAGEFWKNFTYPGHHGPLYPIVLSPFVGIFGIRLVLLKFLSTIFIVSSLWFFYKGFQRIVPLFVLLPALFLVSVNPYVMFFSSYTYSEPLFLFMQSLFIYFFSKYFWQNKTEYSLGKDWKKYLIIVLTIIGLGMTRTIGLCTIGVVMIYFALERRWKDLIYMAAIFTLLFGIIYVSKPIIWPNSSTVQSFESLLAKNPYNLEQGPEDLAGLSKRVVKNSHIYLSSYLYKYLGFRSWTDIPLEDAPGLSVITYLLFIVCLISVFRKNKPLLFAGLYAGTMLMGNFILFNIIWAQDRVLMVSYPFILLFLFGGLYYLFTSRKFKGGFFIYPLILAAILIGTGIHDKNRIGRNIPVLQQNILGDDLYGLTPDWENFIKMSRWVNENLDKDAVVASRKPTISYVYTGRQFFGIYNVPYVNIQEVVEKKEADKDDYIYLAVEIGTKQQLLSSLAPYVQYIFITKQAAGNLKINNKDIQSALVYKIDKSLFSKDIVDFLNTNEFNYTLAYDKFVQQYVDDDNANFQLIDPDALLNFIKESKIKYLILAKIRLYTPQNTGRYINTVHQYISLIQFKYPNLFTLVHTIGKEETCELAEYVGSR